MKSWIIILALLLASCLVTSQVELGPGEEATLYQSKVPGVKIGRKTIGGVYEEVTVRATEDYTKKNLAEWQESALQRVSYGLGILLGGTAIAAALKGYKMESFGVFIALMGALIALHGLITAKIAEYWPWVTLGLAIVISGLVIYIFHGKGLSDLVDKIRKKGIVP